VYTYLKYLSFCCFVSQGVKNLITCLTSASKNASFYAEHKSIENCTIVHWKNICVENFREQSTEVETPCSFTFLLKSYFVCDFLQLFQRDWGQLQFLCTLEPLLNVFKNTCGWPCVTYFGNIEAKCAWLEEEKSFLKCFSVEIFYTYLPRYAPFTFILRKV
jgi:hypothetical protein